MVFRDASEGYWGGDLSSRLKGRRGSVVVGHGTCDVVYDICSSQVASDRAI